MKICFVTDRIDNIGGLQRVLINIANELSKKEQIDVYILSRNKVSNEVIYKINENIQIIHDKNIRPSRFKYIIRKIFLRILKYIYQMKNVRLATKILFPKKEIAAYEDLLNSYDFDVVIGLAPYLSGILALTDLNSVKIGWLHSSYERYFELDYLKNQGKIYSRLFSSLNELIVLTNRSQDIFMEKTGRKPLVINNPLSFKSEEKSKLKSKNIVFVGRFDYATKGLDKLIEIMHLLSLKSNDFKLTIVGDGDSQSIERLKTDINNKKLNKNISLVGATDNVQKYYLESSLCIVPSTVEGFGVVVTEAMECGVPVISFATEGPSEIIQDNVNGYLIPKYDVHKFADKILYLLENYQERKRLSINAIATAKEYSIDHILEDWLSLIEKYRKNHKSF